MTLTSRLKSRLLGCCFFTASNTISCLSFSSWILDASHVLLLIVWLALAKTERAFVKSSNTIRCLSPTWRKIKNSLSAASVVVHRAATAAVAAGWPDTKCILVWGGGLDSTCQPTGSCIDPLKCSSWFFFLFLDVGGARRMADEACHLQPCDPPSIYPWTAASQWKHSSTTTPSSTGACFRCAFWTLDNSAAFACMSAGMSAMHNAWFIIITAVTWGAVVRPCDLWYPSSMTRPGPWLTLRCTVVALLSP